MYIAAFTAFLLGASPAAQGAPLCPSGHLTIGTDATFPPFSSKVGEDFIGYEIELGNALARELGCESKWINSSFDGIFPALLAGKYDFVLASVTITEERRKSMLFSEPYMNAGQSIAVRRAGGRFASLDALKGKKVGVGLNTTGQYLLEPIPEITLNKYPSVDLALTDLRNGRLDAAVGDRPVFMYMIGQSFPDLTLSGEALNQEQWGIVVAPGNRNLLGHINVALKELKRTGFLRQLDEKFLSAESAADQPNRSEGAKQAQGGERAEQVPGGKGAGQAQLRDGGQEAGADKKTGGAEGLEGTLAEAQPIQGPRFRPDRFLSSIPLFLKGARWTLILSLLSFLAALPLGLLIALARMGRLRLLSLPATAYVEVLRGTPLLVQLFFIYFVLPAFGIRLAEHTTAIVALSINTSAYVSEIFRAGLESLEAGQGEAAAALGLTRVQALRYVLIPQAFRRVVPPLTNECIALIKESSLVSIMGMTELTRTGQELASRYADPLTIWPGIALTYFLMTFPLTRLSAHLERKLHAGQRRE